jgi:hypothetical protein
MKQLKFRAAVFSIFFVGIVSSCSTPRGAGQTSSHVSQKAASLFQPTKETLSHPKQAAFLGRPLQMAGKVPELATHPDESSIQLVAVVLGIACFLGLTLGAIAGAFAGGAKWALGSALALAVLGIAGGTYLVQKFPALFWSPVNSQVSCTSPSALKSS